jgi:hypothetical protein
MTKEYLKIIRGEICPYCNCETKLVSGEIIYPHITKETIRPKFLDKFYYLCVENNDHYVGTYSDNKTSLGRVADKELRNYKNLGHRTFDPLWKEKTHFISQKEAYDWLSQKMNLPLEFTHFGMFTIDQCKEAINIFENLMQKKKKSIWCFWK